VTRPSILVVEDDEAIRGVLEAALVAEGYEVLIAKDGRSALELATRRTPALILLDLRLPGMDGSEFARAYHQLPGRHAPTIVLSAAPDARERASELGVRAFVAKPFDLDQLILLVERYLAG
jgi:CheY-like chemotaxis protein